MPYPANRLADDHLRKALAWCRATQIPGVDPALWRQDEYGSTIYWPHYGNRLSPHGWEIHHVQATALGGPDTDANITALHWRNNASHGGLLAAALADRKVR